MGTVSTVALVLLPWLVVPTLVLLDWTWRELVPHRDRTPRRVFEVSRQDGSSYEGERPSTEWLIVGERD